MLIGGVGYTYHWYQINQLETTVRDLRFASLQCEQKSILLEQGKLSAERLIGEMQIANEEQQARIGILQRENQNITSQRDQYLSIFKRHDLTNLARAKPGLIEPRINGGTKQVFDDVKQLTQENKNENDSVTPFNYDAPSLDGLQ